MKGRQKKKTNISLHSRIYLLFILNMYIYFFFSRFSQKRRYRKWNYVRNFIPASRVSPTLKDGKVHRGEAVKPTETAINNFERECRSFNGINVASRAASRQRAPTLTTCAHTYCAVCNARTYIIYVIFACYSIILGIFFTSAHETREVTINKLMSPSLR